MWLDWNWKPNLKGYINLSNFMLIVMSLQAFTTTHTHIFYTTPAVLQ